jgi:hypothetical protein
MTSATLVARHQHEDCLGTVTLTLGWRVKHYIVVTVAAEYPVKPERPHVVALWLQQAWRVTPVQRQDQVVDAGTDFSSRYSCSGRLEERYLYSQDQQSDPERSQRLRGYGCADLAGWKLRGYGCADLAGWKPE